MTLETNWDVATFVAWVDFYLLQMGISAKWEI